MKSFGMSIGRGIALTVSDAKSLRTQTIQFANSKVEIGVGRKMRKYEKREKNKAKEIAKIIK